VIPVPLHNNKLRKRGYNQSFILARHISRIWGPELAQNILFKNKDTPAQVELKREQRYANVEGCFLAKPFKRLPETKILLVDDVLTTGATMSACASELERSGLTNIMGFTLCYSTLS
jgi:ComF family protein